MATIYTDPGDFRSVIDIIDPGVEPDGEGQIGDPVTIASGLYAKIEAISARELYKTQQVLDEVVYRVTIPYTPDLKTRYQVLFEGRTWDIYGILDPDMLHVELRIMCSQSEDGD